jgi:hypothetical protein
VTFKAPKTTIAVFIALAVAALAYGQQPRLDDALLDHLVGQWILTGTRRSAAST